MGGRILPLHHLRGQTVRQGLRMRTLWTFQGLEDIPNNIHAVPKKETINSTNISLDNLNTEPQMCYDETYDLRTNLRNTNVKEILFLYEEIQMTNNPNKRPVSHFHLCKTSANNTYIRNTKSHDMYAILSCKIQLY